jgi:hypothetical protein
MAGGLRPPSNRNDASAWVAHFAGRREWISVSLLVAAVLSYAFWLSNRSFQLVSWSASGVDPNSLLFNSMLAHMVHGRFDVDPATIGVEGFVRHGRVYADWGIFPALVRVPLLLFPGGLRLDVTCLSTLLAVTTAATVKFNTLRLVFRDVASSSTAVLYWALLLAVLFGGAQIEFLKASVYQEACLWAGALGACFVFLGVRGLLEGQFSIRSLCSMAAIAGFALSRATIGVGLYLATVFLLVAIHRKPTSTATGPVRMRALHIVRDLCSSRSFVLPATVLSLFALLTGFVNYERWGDPLQFADYHRYFFYNAAYPERLARLTQYGVFNPARIPFGVIYYFLPIWVIQRADGQQLFQEHVTRLFDSMELPPSSFLLTDALLFGLLAFSFWALASRRKLPINRRAAVAVVAGLTAPCVLILSFDVLAFRYRIDFYPFIEFSAFLGTALLLQSSLLGRKVVRWGLLIAAAMSIFASYAELRLYRASDFGSALGFKPGILYYYSHALDRTSH